jgi:hypothetical protein
MDISIDPEESRRTLERDAGARKVALIFLLKIEDFEAYKEWLDQTEGKMSGRRLHRVKVDPVPREGMVIDEIVIDEHCSSQSALEFMST